MSVFERQPKIHGRRKEYQRGCHCRRCKGAEATYRQQLRVLKLRGHQPRGARISARATWKQIRAMKPEGLTLTEIAKRLGYQFPIHFGRSRMTRHNVLKIDAFYRQMMLEDPDAPHA